MRFTTLAVLTLGICIGFLGDAVLCPGPLPVGDADCQDEPCADPPCCNGDVNGDGALNISDAVYIINYIFASGNPPEEYAAADVNCDETVNVSDAVWIINYIFVGGNQPCDIDGDGIPDC